MAEEGKTGGKEADHEAEVGAGEEEVGVETGDIKNRGGDRIQDLEIADLVVVMSLSEIR